MSLVWIPTACDSKSAGKPDSKSENATPVQDATALPGGESNPARSSTPRDAKSLTLHPGKGIGTLNLGATEAEVVAALGEPSAKLGTNAWIYEASGLTLFISRNSHTLTSFAAGSLLTFEEAQKFTGATDKGIHVGSSKAEVLAAHGNPESSNSDPKAVGPDAERLSYRALGLEVTLKGGKAVYFGIRPPR
jgi:hypothetical protein